jgi:putative ATP-binding cassette transporter
MMKLYRFLLFLLRDARSMMVLMVLTGLLAGLSSVGLLAVINKLINGAGATSELFAVAFIGLAVLKVVSNYLSQLLLVTFAQKTILNLGWISVGKWCGPPIARWNVAARMKFWRR